MEAIRRFADRFFLTLLIIYFSVLLISCNQESKILTQDYWPTKGWRTALPEAHGVKSEKLADMLEVVQKEKHGIDSILVCRNGYLILDAYMYPFQKNQKHVIHSCTKSFTSALVGIAIDKGSIKSVDTPVLEFFPEITPANPHTDKNRITLEHVLMMASGLECRDSWKYYWKGLRAIRQSADWTRFMLDLPMTDTPGTAFEYCNGGSYLLSAILQKATGETALDYARKHLFGPLGITDVVWPANPKGITIGWGEMRLQPRDMAKFGLLYLNQGRWENTQVVSESWVQAATEKHIDGNIFQGYGYQWWVDAAGYHLAIGYMGQYIAVIPDKQMVAVFTCHLEDRSFYTPKKLLDEYIIPAAVSANTIPADSKQASRLRSLADACAAAPAKGFIWESEEEGTAKDGVFVRTAAPAFSFQYPKQSTRYKLNAPGMIMTMKTPKDMRFSAGVFDIPRGMELSDMGPRHYTSGLAHVGKDIRVIDNREIRLSDGSPAYRTDIEWKYKGVFPVTTLLTTAFKDGKCVYVAAHPGKYNFAAEKIVSSLVLK